MMVRKLDDQSRKGESCVDGSNGAINAKEYSFMILFMVLPAFFSDLIKYIFSFKIKIIFATKMMMLLIMVVFVW